MTFMRFFSIIVAMAFLCVSLLPFVCPAHSGTGEGACEAEFCAFNPCNPGNAVLAAGMMPPFVHETHITVLKPMSSETIVAAHDVLLEFDMAAGNERPPSV